jgi:hypothetical protein
MHVDMYNIYAYVRQLLQMTMATPLYRAWVTKNDAQVTDCLQQLTRVDTADSREFKFTQLALLLAVR